MEVLVSPNDGPQISIEDYDDTPDDSPFTNKLCNEFDTLSMCEPSSPVRSHGRLFSENTNDVHQGGVDKLLDRKFACYGVSPRLTRKTNEFCNLTPISKDARPRTLDITNKTADKLKESTISPGSKSEGNEFNLDNMKYSKSD